MLVDALHSITAMQFDLLHALFPNMSNDDNDVQVLPYPMIGSLDFVRATVPNAGGQEVLW